MSRLQSIPTSYHAACQAEPGKDSYSEELPAEDAADCPTTALFIHIKPAAGNFNKEQCLHASQDNADGSSINYRP